MSSPALLLAVIACASEAVSVNVEGPRVWVEAAQVDAGAPVLLHASAEVEVPAVEGLEVRRTQVSDDGSAVWELRGDNGSYEVQVPVPGEEPVTLFLDIGAVGPREELAPLLSPEEEPPPAWPWVLAGVPVLGNDWPEIRRLVAGEGCGWVVAEEAWQAAVDGLTWEAVAAARARTAAAAARYSWAQEETVLLDVYQKVLHAKI